MAENFLELAVILLLGSLVTFAALVEPRLAGWLLAPLLIVAIRPAAVLAFLSVSETPLRERLFIGAFGVKGVASVYYAAVVLGEGCFRAPRPGSSSGRWRWRSCSRSSPTARAHRRWSGACSSAEPPQPIVCRSRAPSGCTSASYRVTTSFAA